jgi:UDP-N-acetyl-D-glucosamine dehydrogenase
VLGETSSFTFVEVTADEVRAADAVVLITDHDGFDYELISEHARFILDTRNRLDGPAVERL